MSNDPKMKSFRDKLAENPGNFDHADCRPEGAAPDYRAPYSKDDLEQQERLLDEALSEQPTK
jgi:hypothetical protein